MGALGGFLWHFAKGWRNSPKYEKFNGAMFSGTLKSPAVGSAFATWGGLFCAFDCTLAYARGGKEDSWNPVIAGAATGGVLSMRSGWRSCARNAAVGGILLGIIEVVQIVSPCCTQVANLRRGFTNPLLLALVGWACRVLATLRCWLSFPGFSLSRRAAISFDYLPMCLCGAPLFFFVPCLVCWGCLCVFIAIYSLSCALLFVCGQMFLRGAPTMTPRKQFQQMKEYEELQQQAAAGNSSSLWSRLIPTPSPTPSKPQSSSEILQDSAALR